MNKAQTKDELAEVLGYENTRKSKQSKRRIFLLIGVILALQLLVLGAVSVVAGVQASASYAPYQYQGAQNSLSVTLGTIRMIASAIIR